jgi:hypothetical protein
VEERRIFVGRLLLVHHDAPVFCLILVLLVFVYHLNMQSHEPTERAKECKLCVVALSHVIAAVTLTGFLLYLLEKRHQHRHDFSLYRFVVGSVKCES